MKLLKALKHKNKLVNQINKVLEKIRRENSIPDSKMRAYDVNLLMKEYLDLREQLINLKTSIQKANVPIYEKMVRLAELKSTINNLNSIDTSEGIVEVGYNGNTQNKSVVINQKNIDTMIADTEKQIESLQDEIDTYNAITDIEE